MVILITLHLISSNLYATKTFIKQHNLHEHYYFHSHNSSNHLHKHSHTQTNVNLLDFFVHLEDTKKFSIFYSREKYLETIYFIPNPTLESLFRPPKV